MADPEKKQPTPRRKRDNDSSSDGIPEWMLTFSDMMTLLLCFFILLFAFANQDIEKFRSIMGSIQNAFGVQIKRPEDTFAAYSPTRFERDKAEKNDNTQELLSLKLDLLRSLQPEPDMAKVSEVVVQNKAVVLRVPPSELFRNGTAELVPDVDRRLKGLSRFLMDHNLFGTVKAHSSDLAPSGSKFSSNWELTAARAAALLNKLLLENPHLPKNHFKASGYADTQPLVPNNSLDNQLKNDRVEFFFYSPQVEIW